MTLKELAEWGLKEQKNIFLLKSSSIKEEIENISRVKKVNLTKELPDRIILRISLRTPVAFLQGHNLGVDREGVAFVPKGLQRENNEEYPKITSASKDILLGKPDEVLERAVAAYLAVKKLPLKVVTIDASSPENILLYVREGKTEIRMGEGDFVKKAIYLNALLEKLKRQPVEYIDLRFGRDIIVK